VIALLIIYLKRYLHHADHANIFNSNDSVNLTTNISIREIDLENKMKRS